MSPRLALAAALLCGGCIAPDYGEEPFYCQSGICPAGYVCFAGRCRRNAPDLGGPEQARPRDAARDRAVTEAPPDDLPRDQRAADLPASDGPQLPPVSWYKAPPGKFRMGSPAGEACRESDETQHDVTLTRGFEIMVTPVTRAMFHALRGYHPAGLSSCGACPVAHVTWSEAAAYCNALSNATGREPCYACSAAQADVSCAVAGAFAGKGIYGCPGYRLPTEAEHEYAMRAGSTSSLYNGNLATCEGSAPLADAIAWYAANSGGGVRQVGGKRKNAWGLFDMAGNVWEWCHDRYAENLGAAPVTDPVTMTGATAARRGGSFESAAMYLRSANRGYAALSDRLPGLGLRCVRSTP